MRKQVHTSGGKIWPHVNLRSLYRYEKTMYGYVRLVVMNFLPITYVADPDIQAFSHFKVSIILETVQTVICKLVELVYFKSRD